MIEDEPQPYDRSSKWLIQHHGNAMLWLARIRNIKTWRPAQAEVVQPQRLPDGLLEALLEDETDEDLFLLEVATYPERRVAKQMTDDLLLVYLDRGELPEGVALVLRPKGKYRVPRTRNLSSRRGLSSCRLQWRVVELWEIPAEELLQAGDIGLLPWVPLTEFAESPETMLERCREAIEQHAPPDKKANLLAVTQVLTFLRYNDVGMLTILGGKEVMLEVPFLDEIVKEKTREVERETARRTACETAHQYILTFLEARFGDVPRDLVEEVESVVDEKELKGFVRLAASCPDLGAFRSEMARR
jgi:predicted transposase YdaD